MSEANNVTINQQANYPATTLQVAQMFGLPLSGPHLGDHSLPVSEPEDNSGNHFSQIVGNLYVKDGQTAQPRPTPEPTAPNSQSQNHALEPGANSFEKGRPQTANAFLRSVKAVTPYVIVFSVGVFLYFFFFSTFDFGSLFRIRAQVQTAKQSDLAQLEQQNLGAYQNWINQFYFDVSDQSVLDPEADNTGNGLTNFQKYLLNLNPKSYDTLGLGRADSQTLEAGLNPLSGGQLTSEQKAIVDKYFDFEVISNRLALAHLQHSAQVAGAYIPSSTNAFGPTTGTSHSDSLLPAGLDLSTNQPGHLDIPSLKVSAPLMWTQDPKNFDKDLQSGVVHYPGTALPGQIGTTYISGHSSNYVWAKGSFNQVFTHLGDLADNASFSITVPQKNGRDAIFHYVVVGRQQYSPTDQAQFQNTGKSIVALSTCWPVGSTARRLVVFGQLTQVEQ